MKNKTTLFSGLILLSACLPISLKARTADEILGIWQHDGLDVIITKDADRYIGTGKNKDGEDVVVLKGLVFNGGAWSGEIYSARRKKYYPVKCTMDDSGKLSLYIDAGMIKRTLEWERKL